MLYVFTMFASYVAASIFFQKVSRRLDVPAPFMVWVAYVLLLWSLLGMIWQFGPERGIPFFLAVFAVAGPCALLLEYGLKGTWHKSIILCTGLAVLSGVASMTGGWV